LPEFSPYSLKPEDAMFNIYKLTHRLTREVYVGATSNLKDRMRKRFALWSLDLPFFVAPCFWECEVVDLAFTVEDALALEAHHQQAVPAMWRIHGESAGVGLKADARNTVWPYENGPVDIEFATPHPDGRRGRRPIGERALTRKEKRAREVAKKDAARAAAGLPSRAEVKLARKMNSKTAKLAAEVAARRAARVAAKAAAGSGASVAA
jgi:hypothetical protein